MISEFEAKPVYLKIGSYATAFQPSGLHNAEGVCQFQPSGSRNAEGVR